MNANKKKIIGLIEPCWFGLGYIDPVLAKAEKVVVIVSNQNNPKIFGYEGKYHDLIIADVRNEESIIDAIKSSKYCSKIDVLISGNGFVNPICSKVAEHFDLFCLPYDSLLKARRKDLAHLDYDKNNVPHAKFAIIKDYDKANEVINSVGYPIVLKPTDCAGSQNVILVRNSNELKNALEIFKNFNESYLNFKVRKEILVEEFLEGPEFSVELFLYNGKSEFASVTEKITGNYPYFVELGHVVPTSINNDDIKDIIDVAIKAAKSLGFENGPMHIEIRLTPFGPKIVEVNGRPGGDHITIDLLKNAFGVDFFEINVNYYLGLPVKIKPTKNLASSIRFLVANRAGRIKHVEGIEELNNKENVVSSCIEVKVGDFVSIPTESRERLGYVITLADSPSLAKKSALDAINSIKLVYEN